MNKSGKIYIILGLIVGLLGISVILKIREIFVMLAEAYA